MRPLPAGSSSRAPTARPPSWSSIRSPAARDSYRGNCDIRDPAYITAAARWSGDSNARHTAVPRRSAADRLVPCRRRLNLRVAAPRAVAPAPSGASSAARPPAPRAAPSPPPGRGSPPRGRPADARARARRAGAWAETRRSAGCTASRSPGARNRGVVPTASGQTSTPPLLPPQRDLAPKAVSDHRDERERRCRRPRRTESRGPAPRAGPRAPCSRGDGGRAASARPAARRARGCAPPPPRPSTGSITQTPPSTTSACEVRCIEAGLGGDPAEPELGLVAGADLHRSYPAGGPKTCSGSILMISRCSPGSTHRVALLAEVLPRQRSRRARRRRRR